MAQRRVLVVGTTPDYIEWINSLLKGKVFFLTDPELRKNAIETSPDSEEEILCDLKSYNNAYFAVKDHINKYNFTVTGIACFDCESMELASFLAGKMDLDFPSLKAVCNCRNKFTSKAIWEKRGLFTPRAMVAENYEQAKLFFRRLKKGCVLKPISGAGSELVFLCNNEKKLASAYKKISQGLKRKSENRLYSSNNIKNSIVIEEFISGTEYSCDFIIDKGKATILRLTEKLKSPKQIFGIIDGYKLISSIPEISDKYLSETLLSASDSLGIKRAICMVDFIVHSKKIFLIELAPRPGGDCLPRLIEKATGRNVLVITIELSQGLNPEIIDYKTIKPYIALRIFAEKEGIFTGIDCDQYLKNPAVSEINITAYKGKKIELPPKDYDSWILGYMILRDRAKIN